MAGEYDITLSDGVTIVTIYPLEVNGTTFSTPRRIREVNLTGGAGVNFFKLDNDLTYRFVAGFQFVVDNSSGGLNDGTYTVAPAGSTFLGGFTTIPVVSAIPNNALPYGVIQYQVPTAERISSLNLQGKGTVSFGQDFNTNVIHHLENFAHTVAPLTPIKGQIWYDTSVVPSPELKVWNGTTWYTPGTDLYVNITGDTMTGLLVLSANPTLPLHAATKQYVDDTTVSLTGDTMTGNLTMSTGADIIMGAGSTIDMGNNKITNLADPTVATDALNLQTGDNRYVELATNSTMSAFLTLIAPTLPLHAATKQYVDDTATASNAVDYEFFNTVTGLVTLSSIVYVLGSHRLMVYVNGVKQVYPPNGNYTETSTTSITFSPALTLGDQVEVYHI